MSSREERLSDEQIIAALRRYVESCCDREHPPRINEFAETLRISRRQVGLAIQRATGMKAVRFVRARQVERAKALINDGVPLKRVVYRSGFGTRRTFFRGFKQITGLTPRTYLIDSSRVRQR